MRTMEMLALQISHAQPKRPRLLEDTAKPLLDVLLRLKDTEYRSGWNNNKVRCFKRRRCMNYINLIAF